MVEGIRHLAEEETKVQGSGKQDKEPEKDFLKTHSDKLARIMTPRLLYGEARQRVSPPPQQQQVHGVAQVSG